MDFERTFDKAAQNYENSRPDYVPELYADIFRCKHIDAQSDVLEIGVGTGKATRPFLETKCRLVGLEPGENLASLAREKFAGYPNFSLRQTTFQAYACDFPAFDLVYAATAFHWIPEEYGYRRAYELLKSGGVFARFAYHAGSDAQRPELTEAIQAVYGKYYGGTKKAKEFGEEDAKKLAETAEKYGFVRAEYRLYHTTKDFCADAYMDLLTTYPDHMALETENRKRLFEGIHAAIQRCGGRITVRYTMDLEMARKP